MSRLFFTGVFVAASLAVTTLMPVGAVAHDKLAFVAFSGSVQIPGITLSAGTYRFRLANPGILNVLQVLSDDGSTVYAMFHTIPDSRSSLSDDPIVTLKETAEGLPPAVQSLFYGGEYSGYEFVYPTGGPDRGYAARGGEPNQRGTCGGFPAAAEDSPHGIAHFAVPEQGPCSVIPKGRTEP